MSERAIYLIIAGIYSVVLFPDLVKMYRLARTGTDNMALSKYLVKMDLAAFVIGVFFLVTLISFEVNIFRYAGPIPYGKISEITFKDFKGLKIPGQVLEGTSEFAFIACEIDCWKESNSVFVASYFHPSRSYVYNDNIANEELLRHEMYHFRITEIFARKLKKELTNLEEIPDSKIIDLLLENARKSEDSLQSQYDYETYHGTFLGNQVEWQNRIDSTLASLKEYTKDYVTY